MSHTHEGANAQPDYLAYLLRLWRVTVDGKTAWRASLECPYSGERLGFADLEALVDHLHKEMEGEGMPIAPSRCFSQKT